MENKAVLVMCSYPMGRIISFQIDTSYYLHGPVIIQLTAAAIKPGETTIGIRFETIICLLLLYGYVMEK